MPRADSPPPPRRLARFALLAALVAAAAAAIAALRAGPTFTVHDSGAVVISGASTGIGFSAAVALARAAPGLTVYAGVRRAADAARVRAEALRNLKPLELDVADEGSIVRALAAVEAAGAPLVGVVNNAGLARGPTAVEFHAPGDARALFDVNFFGALRLTQLALPALRASRGRVVFVSSIFGALAPPMGGIYSASKFALEAAADALRREVAPLGVAVVIVRPGAVATPIFASLTNASLAAAVRAASPAARAYPHLHTPADLANEVKIEALAAPVAVTDAAILAALRAPRPAARFTVANIVGVPATALEWAARVLPDAALDFVLAQKA